MDIPAIATAVTSCLAPALPYLLKAGEKGIETIGCKMGAGMWETAKAIWQRLSLSPAIESAAREVVSAPEDQDAQAAFRHQLKKILAADEQLASALARLLKEGDKAASPRAEVYGEGAVAQGSGAVAAGKGGVAVGGDVHGDVRIGGTEI